MRFDIIEYMLHRLAIITVIYNNYKILEDFFASFTKQRTNDEFHVYIADLSDKKKEISQQAFPTTIVPSVNLGYAHGVNEGLKKALFEGYTEFCVVNSDIFVDRGFVSAVTSSLSHHPQSIIAGKIFYAPGYEYHTQRYQKKDLGNVLWYAGGTIDWNHALAKHIGVDEIDTGKYDAEGKTGFINGCCMCFDKFVLDKVGYWDESYFLYYEDADYGERAKINTISLYYDPEIVLWHKNAQSTGGSGSFLHTKYQEKNRLRFALKYAPFKTKLHLLKNFFLKGLK